jgi:hypothetical protein
VCLVLQTSCSSSSSRRGAGCLAQSHQNSPHCCLSCVLSSTPQKIVWPAWMSRSRSTCQFFAVFAALLAVLCAAADHRTASRCLVTEQRHGCNPLWQAPCRLVPAKISWSRCAVLLLSSRPAISAEHMPCMGQDSKRSCEWGCTALARHQRH